MSRKRVFIYVQHLLGIGHLKRAVALARASVGEGLEVTLASGGLAPPGVAPDGVRWIQLAPVRAADERFQVLLDEAARPIDDAWRARRRDALLRAWREAEPQLVVTELFPFGRRQMRFELLPWLDAVLAAPRRPVIVSSVRDILGAGQRDRSRQDEMLALFARYYDHVLVHGDPQFVRFERTFRHAPALGARLHYTGYVVDRDPKPRIDPEAGRDEVLVSSGGGAVGLRLLETAIRCRSRTVLADRTWRILAGINVPATAFASLEALAAESGAGRVLVERARCDFRTLLANASLSISQAGYNTLGEILDAGVRAVCVPFSGGREIEQSLRASVLAERGRIECLDDERLAPEALARAVDRAAARPRPARGGIDLDGARASARRLAAWAQGVPW